MSGNAQGNAPFNAQPSPQDVNLWYSELIKHLTDTGPPVRILNHHEQSHLYVQYYLLNIAKQSNLAKTPEDRMAFCEYLSRANYDVLAQSMVVSAALRRLQSENELLRHQVATQQQMAKNESEILRHFTVHQQQPQPNKQPPIQPGHQ